MHTPSSWTTRHPPAPYCSRRIASITVSYGFSCAPTPHTCSPQALCCEPPLIRLRNPWGMGEWTGECSDKSGFWSAENMLKYGYSPDSGAEREDGVFMMPLATFVKIFTEVVYVEMHSCGNLTLEGHWQRRACSHCHASSQWLACRTRSSSTCALSTCVSAGGCRRRGRLTYAYPSMGQQEAAQQSPAGDRTLRQSTLATRVCHMRRMRGRD